MATSMNGLLTPASSALPKTAPVRPNNDNPFDMNSVPNDDVEKRISGLLNQDTDYMRGARAKGVEFANSRGLLNSSMAGRASQASAIDGAFPIASQDASQQFQKNRAAQDFAYSGELQARQIGADATRLDTQIQAERLTKQMDLDQQKLLASWNIDANEKQQVGQMLTQMQSLYSARVQSIMANTAMSAQDRSLYLREAEIYAGRINNLVEQVFSVDIAWDAPTGPTMAEQQGAAAAQATLQADLAEANRRLAALEAARASGTLPAGGRDEGQDPNDYRAAAEYGGMWGQGPQFGLY